MNELQLHGQYVEEHHTDKLAALALADRLYEECGFTRFAALRDAAQHRKIGRDAHELAQAARAIAPGSCMQKPITDHIREATGHIGALGATILLVAGRRHPRLHFARVATNPPTKGAQTITVGARWVLRECKLILASWGVAFALTGEAPHEGQAE